MYKNPYYITSNVVEVWCNNYFLKNNQSDFLSKLIYSGKVMFFVKNILPKNKDYNNLRFSKKQMDWLLNNESKIWSFIIENKLLYSQRERDYRSFFYYSPFVKGMPKEAPARLGYFIGYKIIDSYMKNNRVSISELMLENDYSKIFEGDNNWDKIKVESSSTFEWSIASSYIKKPPFLDTPKPDLEKEIIVIKH